MLNTGDTAVVEVNVLSLNMEVCCDFLTIDGKKYVPIGVSHIFSCFFLTCILWPSLVSDPGLSLQPLLTVNDG